MAWKIVSSALSSSLAVAAMMLMAGAGNAGERHRDYVYADSFGNLVVYSRAGYKRIVVGQGHLAAELNAYVSGAPEEVVRLDDEAGDGYRDCYRPPVLLKGRSYMYGLMEGELPEPSGSCFTR